MIMCMKIKEQHIPIIVCNVRIFIYKGRTHKVDNQ